MTLTNQGEAVRVGIELEYPKMVGDEKFKGFGRGSSGAGYIARDEWSPRGEATYELIGGQTYGTEIRTPDGGLLIDEVGDWYREVLNKYPRHTGEPMEPVGLMGGTTAGLHTHISPLTRKQAQTLYDFSKEPWMWVFACSTLADSHALGDQPAATVLRSKLAEEAPYRNYCEMKLGGGHHHLVNRRIDNHYEWRLPEPMTPEHFELLMEFIRLFIEDPDRAENFARSLVSSGDERLTSIRRAQEIGLEKLETGITSVAFDSIRGILAPTTTETEEALAD